MAVCDGASSTALVPAVCQAEVSRKKMKREGSLEHEVDCYRRLQSLVHLLKDCECGAGIR